MRHNFSLLTALLFLERCLSLSYSVYVSLGENAILDFTFSHSSKTPAELVQWSFLPHYASPTKSEIRNHEFYLNASYPSSRYKNDISTVICPNYLSSSPGRKCQLARLSISHVITADEGVYRVRVVGAENGSVDCSPCSGDLNLHILDDENSIRQFRNDDPTDDAISSVYMEDSNDAPSYFYAPPFTLDFNMNSTVCVGQRFEFQCRAEPTNYGINLTLYQLDPLFTFSNLEAASGHGNGIDFRNTSTRAIQTSISRKATTRHLQYILSFVSAKDTGGYLCVASVPEMQAARWSYMFLQVDDCKGFNPISSPKPFRERVLEVFTSPAALAFICILLALLFVAIILLFWHRHHLPFFVFGSKRWSKAASKVVRETNLLYPWASHPHHNCSHQMGKDVTDAATDSCISTGCHRLGRNLQVPAVIIQVDSSVTAGGCGDGSGNGDRGGSEAKSSAYKIPSDPDWEVPRQNVCLGHQIGAGAFGVVYAGKVSEPNKVLPGLRRRGPSDYLHDANDANAEELCIAVKTLRDNFTEQELADLVREMEILKQFDPHPHVIQLYGVCTQNGKLQVLVELAPYGNLRDFLIDRRPQTGQKSKARPLSRLSTCHLVNFGLQVARGMDYLTRLNIVHRDLAARNILIGSRFVAKISDFGLTRAACDYYRKCSDGRLPIKWMAPESIFDRRYTAKSDVWSFGILLWEIFSFGGTPYPTLSAEALLKALQLGFRNEQPLTSPGIVYNLMHACWSIEPAARPSFAGLVSTLQQVYNDTTSNNVHEHTSMVSSATSSPSLSTPSSSTVTRASSPTISTVYLTLNDTTNAIAIANVNNNANENSHGYHNQDAMCVTQALRAEQWPTPSLSRNFNCHQAPRISQPGAGSNAPVNTYYPNRGQYLQSIHKAFSMHCNYVVPPQPSRQVDYLGPRS